MAKILDGLRIGVVVDDLDVCELREMRVVEANHCALPFETSFGCEYGRKFVEGRGMTGRLSQMGEDGSTLFVGDDG